MNVSFVGTRVVVTGATGIVGRRIVLAFAKEGARLYLSAHERQSDIAEQALKAGAAEATYVPTNLSESEAVTGLCQKIEEHWHGVEVVVNNAGLYPLQSLLSMSVETWDYVMGVNLRAPFLITRELAKTMIKGHISGSIVNISSGAAFRAKVGHGHYSTSKAGLEMLTKSYALELAPFNIRVNSVIPGFTPGSAESPLPEDYIERMTKSIPLERVSGEMDAAAAVLFLSSPLTSFVTGSTIAVDGGRSAGTLNAQDRQALLSSM